MEKQNKTIHSMRIDNDVWKSARDLKINISGEIEKHLRGLTKNSISLIDSFSYCKLCGEQKEIETMFKLTIDEGDFEYNDKNENGDDLYIIYFVCKDCLMNVQNNVVDNYDKDVVKFVESAIRSRDKLMKQNKDPEIINQVREGEIKFTSEFSESIGLYDAEDIDEKINSIRELITEIKEKPLINYMISPGEFKVVAKEWFEGYED